MAQLCGGGDGKVSCETLAAAVAAPPPEDPDLPAESYVLAAGDEIGWVEANAVYERDDSTKGSTNPKSHQQQQQQQQKLVRPGSQRFSGSLAPKAPIIGLPNKIQHSGYLGHSSRRPPMGRIFPKKSPSGGGRSAAPPPPEPGSPKVSCFGKVLSERERDLCRRRCEGSAAAGGAEEGEREGCWASLAAFFRCGGGGGRTTAAVEEEEEEFAEVFSVTTEGRPSAAAAAAAPGIGGMKRFSSGRRAASWGGEMDGGRVAQSGALDREDVWGRRSVGSLEEAERERIW